MKDSKRNMSVGTQLIQKVIEDYRLEDYALIVELWALRTATSFYKRFDFKDDLDDGSQPTSQYMYLIDL